MASTKPEEEFVLVAHRTTPLTRAERDRTLIACLATYLLTTHTTSFW